MNESTRKEMAKVALDLTRAQNIAHNYYLKGKEKGSASSSVKELMGKIESALKADDLQSLLPCFVGGGSLARCLLAT